MIGTDYPLSADDGPDDLPRTLRRAREEREQAQREAEAQSARTAPAPSLSSDPIGPTISDNLSNASPVNSGYAPGLNETTVTRLNIPFGHLAKFFIKAVFASIPALILLLAILWGIGQALEMLFPELIKMKIQIYFPH